MPAERKKLKRAATLLLLISLIDFLFYYIVTLTLGSYDFAVYTVFFVGKLTSFALPAIIAAILVFEDGNAKEKILRAAGLSLTRLVYYVPYFYLDYVYDVFDSIESICLSAATSALAALGLAAVSLLCYLIVKLIMKKFKKTEDKESLFPLPLFSIENEAALGIFMATLTLFGVSLISEIIDTVSFFIDVGSRYRAGEIVFMIGKYVFLVFSLLFTHFISCYVVNKLSEKRDDNQK